MAPNIRLPAYRAPGPLDFRGLNQGVDALSEGLQRNRMLQQREEIGEQIQSGDYGAGAKTAYGQGNLKLGLSLDEAQRSKEQQRRQLQQQRASAARKRQDEMRQRVGRMASYVKGIQDPQQRQRYAERLFNAHPKFRAKLDEYGVDLTDPEAGLGFLMAEAGIEPDKPQFETVSPGDRIVDPRTGRVIAEGPSAAEFEREKAAARAEGKMMGEERAQRPQTLAKAERMLKSVDDALNDPGTFQATGPVGGLLPNVFPGSTRGQSRIDQIRGQTFLQAYQDLKGGGQITEVEGGKAEDALARINAQNMEDDDYRKALEDLRDVVVKGLRRAKGLSTDDDVIQSLSEARRAIQRGADPNAVRDRLIENGIDPTGL